MRELDQVLTALVMLGVIMTTVPLAHALLKQAKANPLAKPMAVAKFSLAFMAASRLLLQISDTWLLHALYIVAAAHVAWAFVALAEEAMGVDGFRAWATWALEQYQDMLGCMWKRLLGK